MDCEYLLVIENRLGEKVSSHAFHASSPEEAKETASNIVRVTQAGRSEALDFSTRVLIGTLYHEIAEIDGTVFIKSPAANQKT